MPVAATLQAWSHETGNSTCLGVWRTTWWISQLVSVAHMKSMEVQNYAELLIILLEFTSLSFPFSYAHRFTCSFTANLLKLKLPFAY